MLWIFWGGVLGKSQDIFVWWVCLIFIGIIERQTRGDTGGNAVGPRSWDESSACYHCWLMILGLHGDLAKLFLGGLRYFKMLYQCISCIYQKYGNVIDNIVGRWLTNCSWWVARVTTASGDVLPRAGKAFVVVALVGILVSVMENCLFYSKSSWIIHKRAIVHSYVK